MASWQPTDAANVEELGELFEGDIVITGNEVDGLKCFSSFRLFLISCI